MLTKLTLTAVIWTLVLPAFAQRVGSSAGNTVPDSQVRVNSRPTNSAISNYNYYNNASRYQLSPYMLYQRQNLTPRRVVGNVQPYSDVDYGRLVISTLEPADPTVTAERTTLSGSILDHTSQTIAGAVPTAQTNISDIIDRGILILPTREELRLRGVILPSESSSSEIDRLYAREAINLLRTLIAQEQVTLAIGDPARDLDGRILATVFLPDGTELNKLMIERGYGRVRGEDFSPNQDFSDLTAAQQKARDTRVGLWSKNQ